MTTDITGKAFFRSRHVAFSLPLHFEWSAILKDVHVTLESMQREILSMSRESALAEPESDEYFPTLVEFRELENGTLYNIGRQLKVTVDGKKAPFYNDAYSGILHEGQKLVVQGKEKKARLEAEWKPSLREGKG